ncbi:MAG TPA: ribosome biogenesis GTPase Der [Polyangia bacterium]|nr:ribosome biogenesis GTPase Der [Polyangia bacterium]
MSEPELPLLAVVGRPNVGKSTLFNRLVGRRSAIVHDQPGVTRDRRYAIADWAGKSFRLVDTGGLDPEAKADLLAAIGRQARLAIAEAALVLFVVDAQEGPTALDCEVAADLRRLGRPVLLVANKVDSAAAEAAIGPLFELGFPEVWPVSAEHGRGMAELCDAVLDRLPGAPATPETSAQEAIKLALVGKPNAGKSSLVNRLLGEDRVLVHEAPGTTRDPIDTPLEWQGQPFVLIDTAGIRKHRTAYTMTERVAVDMAHRAIERADVVALIIDGREGPSEQDSRIAGEAAEKGRALVLVLSKADLLSHAEEDALRRRVRDELAHVDWAPILATSALTGRQVERVVELARSAFAQYARRVPTAQLNRLFEGILAEHPPPHYKGKSVRLYYITQAETRPPTFVVQANFPEAVPFAYRRYLTNQLRAAFGFRGTPIRLLCRRRPRRK